MRLEQWISTGLIFTLRETYLIITVGKMGIIGTKSVKARDNDKNPTIHTLRYRKEKYNGDSIEFGKIHSSISGSERDGFILSISQ